MSGGTKQQFKQFSITCAEDACLVLGMLISGMTVNLEKYKEYASEAESLLESTQEEYVPAKEYDDVNDKLLYRQREILKFTADHQSSSFSYIMSTEQTPVFAAATNSAKSAKAGAKGYAGSCVDSASQSTWQA